MTKYKKVKLTNFLKIKYRYQLIVRQKVIKNFMGFFHLLIFYIFHL